MRGLRSALIRLEDWITDESALLEMAKFLAVFLLILGLCVFVGASLYRAVGGTTAEEDCLESGRGWAVVGKHTQLVLVGKMLIPQTFIDHGCVEVVR